MKSNLVLRLNSITQSSQAREDVKAAKMVAESGVN